MNMSTQLLYNDFPTFCGNIFHKVQKDFIERRFHLS